jgi:hypothetical protein
MSIQGPQDERRLEERLKAAFAGLDTRPDFDTRFKARLASVSQLDAAALAGRARRSEQERYRAALERASWRREVRSLTRHLTLDTLGAAALIAVAILAVWTELGPLIGQQLGPQFTDGLRQNAAIVWPSVVGMMLGLSPLLARWLRTPGPA